MAGSSDVAVDAELSNVDISQCCLFAHEWVLSNYALLDFMKAEIARRFIFISRPVLAEHVVTIVDRYCVHLVAVPIFYFRRSSFFEHELQSSAEGSIASFLLFEIFVGRQRSSCR